MGKLSKSSKALIGFIVFLIYVAISGIIGSKRQTMKGTDQTFGAVELPLNSELTGLGLDNSVVSDHIDKEHQLHDYKIDLQKKAITYNYYTREASYGDKFKVITYSTTQDTVQALYWYDNGVGYCFEAVNMPSLEQESFIEMAGKYWNEGSATDEE